MGVNQNDGNKSCPIDRQSILTKEKALQIFPVDTELHNPMYTIICPNPDCQRAVLKRNLNLFGDHNCMKDLKVENDKVKGDNNVLHSRLKELNDALLSKTQEIAGLKQQLKGMMDPNIELMKKEIELNDTRRSNFDLRDKIKSKETLIKQLQDKNKIDRIELETLKSQRKEVAEETKLKQVNEALKARWMCPAKELN